MGTKNILVTGGAGFIGSNLVARLQADEPEAHIIVIDDLRSGSFTNLCREGPGGWSFRGQFIARSLNDLDLYDLIERHQPHVIFHEASITDTTVMDESKMIRDNVEPFEQLVDLSAEYQIKLVWASSGATYGTNANGATAAKRPFAVGDAGCPANVYGFSKWIMENLHRRALADYPELHIVGLRYFNVFGPGEQHKKHMASMIYQLAQQMLDGKRQRIFHDGEQARDHVYVKDVVEATLAAAGDHAVRGIYNVGSGSTTTFNQLIEALNEALGSGLEPEYFENPYAFYQPYTCADLAQTRQGLGWLPRHSTRQAVMEYARFLKADRQMKP